jgi:tRNA(Ile)-lysidine synthase
VRGDVSAALPVPAFIQHKFSEFSARLDGDGPIGVAVSGGGDSVALLYALAAWKQRPLEVFCVDHGLNPLSPQWTQSVADHAARCGVGFTALHWHGEKPTAGIAAVARLARHRLLAQAARDKGISVLCLAHTADDIAEAQVMRAQGSSVGAPKVWAPSPVWPEGRGVCLYRPFLDVRRDTLRGYLRETGATWIDDPANESPRSLRARTRKALSGTMIETPVNERPVTEADITLSQAQMADLLYQPEKWAPLGMIALRAEKFHALPRESALKVLAAAAVCAGGGDKLPRAEKVDALRGQLSAEMPRTLVGARVWQTKEMIAISREAGDIGRNRSGVMMTDGQGAAVWDGRFAIRSGAIGEIVASADVRGYLSDEDRAWLMRLPAALRGSQPVFVATGQKDNRNKGLLTNPSLRQGRHNGFRTCCLVLPRFQSALGLIRRESDLAAAKEDCVLTRKNGV